MVLSYLWIRRAVGALAISLPVVLGLGGYLFFDVDIQENISSYYHTPLRDVFVGVMCAIGLFLFSYYGSSMMENWTGNVAALAAVGVAWFPLDANSDPLDQHSIAGYLHSVFGTVFFLAIAMYSVYHFPRNEPEDYCPDGFVPRNLLFRFTGVVILACLGLMGTYLFLLEGEDRAYATRLNILFWLESAAIWAFAVAWLVKGRIFAVLTEGVEFLRSLEK